MHFLVWESLLHYFSAKLNSTLPLFSGRPLHIGLHQNLKRFDMHKLWKSTEADDQFALWLPICENLVHIGLAKWLFWYEFGIVLHVKYELQKIAYLNQQINHVILILVESTIFKILISDNNMHQLLHKSKSKGTCSYIFIDSILAEFQKKKSMMSDSSWCLPKLSQKPKFQKKLFGKLMKLAWKTVNKNTFATIL